MSGCAIPIPEHLIELPGTTWALWRWAGLRSAGFPIAQVLQLAVPACAAATDRFLEQEAKAEHLRHTVLRALSREAKGVAGGPRNLLSKALRRVKEGKLPGSLPFALTDETQAHLDAFRSACSERERAWSELRGQFDTATVKTTQSLYEIACSRRFREAVMWQDREAVHSSIDPFLRKSTGVSPTAKQRQQCQMIAKYVQRYCAKNDSIGFFGPVGWARWASGGAAVEARPGTRLLASRTVYFETWAIDALGEALARNRALLPWAVPRPMPFLYLEGTTLHVPFARPLQLTDAQAAVFATCDGQRTARDISQALLRTDTHVPGLASEAEVFAILEHLCATRRIAWTFEVSVEDWYPECGLRRQLERITEEPACQMAMSALDRLEEARTTVAGAAGDVERLDQALEHLEATFTDLTNKASSREAGKTYAARTLVYEDCRRDIELTLGPALLSELEPPLELLLTSARWFTHAAAQLYRKAFKEAYTELAGKAGSSAVAFATFWPWVQPLLSADPAQRLINILVPELQERWAAVLALPAGQRHVDYTSEHLRQRVREVFDAPGPGWPSACYHSPDVLIATTGLEAIQQGDYQLVLGEFHLGRNTLDVVGLAAQHPAPNELFQATAADLPGPRVVPILPRHALPAKRTHFALTLPKDWRFIFGIDSCDVPPTQALYPGNLVIEEVADELVARTRDGHRQFDLLEIFDVFFSIQVCDCFKILHPASHTPRVTIDRLVVCRESWRFAPAALAFAFGRDAMERYTGARRWARVQGLPRFLFVRTPVEQKPYYVDLDSPIYVELFAKAIRQAQEGGPEDGYVTVTEMLPDPEHAWLPDAGGNRYTGEVRIVAVDQLKNPANPIRR